MGEVLDRVKKLLAMAESPVEEEARTAALMAAKLINQYKLVVSEQALVSPPPTVIVRPVQRRPRNGWYNDEPTIMRSKRGSLCRACGRPIRPGETVVSKGATETHEACSDYWRD